MKLRRDVFQAIADPARRGDCVVVATQSMIASAIASNFDTARPTVSKTFTDPYGTRTARASSEWEGGSLPYQCKKYEGGGGFY